MGIKVVIDGLGRVGRAILRLVIDEPSLEMVGPSSISTLRESSMETWSRR